MAKLIIHLATPASPGRAVMQALGLSHARELIGRVQRAVGGDYEVRGRASIIEAATDDRKGGRTDDAARIRELNYVLANDKVVALVAVRGGGWLTRLLPHIDFGLLDQRTRPLAVFGFSEITPLVNIIGSHPRGFGYYYMTPGYPRTGMARYARLNAAEVFPRAGQLSPKAAAKRAERWAAGQLAQRFTAYFQEVVSILEGRGPSRLFTGRLVSGRLPADSKATVIGGCLSLVTALATNAFRSSIKPAGKWIALEDLEEAPHRIDRQFAHLKLAGWFERCAGVLLGDFHEGDHDQTEEALAILKCHLPRDRQVPVIVSRDLGHTWPQSVLAMGRRMVLRCTTAKGQGRRVEFHAPWSDWKVN